MKTQLKSANYLTLIVAAAVADLLWIPLVARGQALSGSTLTVSGSTTLQGNVSVTGPNSVVDFYGNSLYLGTATSGTTTSPGISALYTDGATSSFSLLSASPSHQWSWGYLQSSGSSAPMMTLDPTNGLTIYDTSGNSLVLNPNTASGGGPSTLLTQAAADSRYVSNANFMVGSALDWQGNPQPMIALAGGTATGAGSFAGINATASGAFSNASGYQSSASGWGSNASGYQSSASGWGATASGYNSSASGDDSIASGEFSVASGLGSTASGYCSTASGFLSTASGYFSIASGYGSIASGYGSNASGWGSRASGWGSTASGYGSIASGYGSNASGWRSRASGLGSTASGYGSTASGYYSSASGLRSTASGDYSNASGRYSIASGNYSNASGHCSNAAVYGEFVIGQFNISQGDPYNWVPTDELFVIGNGTGDGYLDQDGNWHPPSQSNAIVVKKNGDTTINGGLTVTGTADESGTIVASGSTQLVLIPQQGDLSMGEFKAGSQPLAIDYSQMSQQNVQNLASRPSANTALATNASALETARNKMIESARARAAARGVQLPPIPTRLQRASGSNSVTTTGTTPAQ